MSVEWISYEVTVDVAEHRYRLDSGLPYTKHREIAVGRFSEDDLQAVIWAFQNNQFSVERHHLTIDAATSHFVPSPTGENTP